MAGIEVSIAPQSPMLINVGCGNVFHPAWANFDYSPACSEVRACDLRQGLPIASGTADAVYHSHVLEHLSAEDGRTFLCECRRVLRPGGVLRVAVPDLEKVVRSYLAVLDAPGGVDPVMHEWMRLELFDQFMRGTSGGAMARFFRQLGEADRGKIRRRIGQELDLMLSAGARPSRRMLSRLRAAGWRRVLERGREQWARVCLRLIGGRRFVAAFDEGIFRARGEVHRCAYDRYSLRAVMESCGFDDVGVCAAGESRIPSFADYGLEIDGGLVRKPDSLFMEGVKR